MNLNPLVTSCKWNHKVFVSDLLISFNVVSKFIHVVACIYIHTTFYLVSVDRHKGFFCLLVIVINTAVNMGILVRVVQRNRTNRMWREISFKAFN